MNFVGKILVLVILVFSILFASLASVVFATAKNHRVELTKQRDQFNRDLAAIRAERDRLTQDLSNAESDRVNLAQEVQKLKEQLETIGNTITAIEDDRKAARTELEVVNRALEAAQSEAAFRLREMEVLSVNLKKSQDDANALKIEQTNLNAKIAELTRELATAKAQNATLREDNAAYAAWMRSKGFNDDIATIRGVSAPPKVEGIVLRVDSSNKRLEISIGSDVGLVPDHELFVYRTSPPEFLGKIRIVETDPDRSAAVVVGKTYQGKLLQEGDIVSATLPRGF
ncbi:hypothetical protein Isop_0018 [Isosphaera pallida ATCC 43644]|jgi:septal ring factor EnvC (AmiA/AmiB activator)|uniref:Chromosome partition protein Smc n=1 Tax=Isosphaera pallida (strain ATCC 43644 / DSM 9630 / IS1B) TaxID=575540 RepID=E8R4M4_ISOPI|nr:hypothetical protein [Isosphaera pallida]ADV60615.1 hypothetical protein Isop_0018 [Isosphaera pallida ATCC 43644]